METSVMRVVDRCLAHADGNSHQSLRALGGGQRETRDTASCEVRASACALSGQGSPSSPCCRNQDGDSRGSVACNLAAGRVGSRCLPGGALFLNLPALGLLSTGLVSTFCSLPGSHSSPRAQTSFLEMSLLSWKRLHNSPIPAVRPTTQPWPQPWPLLPQDTPLACSLFLSGSWKAAQVSNSPTTDSKPRSPAQTCHADGSEVAHPEPRSVSGVYL